MRVHDCAFESVEFIKDHAQLISKILIQSLHEFTALLTVRQALLHVLHRLSQKSILTRYRILLEDFLKEVVGLSIFLNFFKQTDQLLWRLWGFMEQVL